MDPRRFTVRFYDNLRVISLNPVSKSVPGEYNQKNCRSKSKRTQPSAYVRALNYHCVLHTLGYSVSRTNVTVC